MKDKIVHSSLFLLVLALSILTSCVNERDNSNSEQSVVFRSLGFEVAKTCDLSLSTGKVWTEFIHQTVDFRDPGYRLSVLKDRSQIFIGGLANGCELNVVSKQGPIKEVNPPTLDPFDSSSRYSARREASSFALSQARQCEQNLIAYLTLRAQTLTLSDYFTEAKLRDSAGKDQATPCGYLLEADSKSIFLRGQMEIILVELVAGQAFIGVVK